MALSEKTNADLVDRTIDLWAPRVSRELTRDDAEQILQNVSGFFSVLSEWRRAERARSTRPSSQRRGPSEARYDG